MAAIAQPLNLSGYKPFPVQTDPQPNSFGDAVATAIEALKTGGESVRGSLPAYPSPDPGFRQPDIGQALGQAGPALNPDWAARGITPPQAPAQRNPYNQIGNLLGEIRQLGPDWKTELAKKYGNRLGGR